MTETLAHLFVIWFMTVLIYTKKYRAARLIGLIYVTLYALLIMLTWIFVKVG